MTTTHVSTQLPCLLQSGRLRMETSLDQTAGFETKDHTYHGLSSDQGEKREREKESKREGKGSCEMQRKGLFSKCILVSS